MAQCINIHYIIDRGSIGLPPFVTSGYAAKNGRQYRAFNKYGRPVDLKIDRKLFSTGETVVDGVLLQRA